MATRPLCILLDDLSCCRRPVPILIVTVLALLFIGWLIWQPRWVAHRRARQQTEGFPPAWRAIIRRNVPLAASLPADLQTQLRRHILVFLSEKTFVGCQGQVIDDEVRVTIAAQACLLLLNRPSDYFPALRQVLVYPSAFEVDITHTDEIGVVQSGRDWRAGESWQEGQVILSWEDVLTGAAEPNDGWNVVIHEFAHQLDSETGLTNGTPALPSPHRQASWSKVMQAEFDALVAAVERGEEDTFLDPYGASEPAEFFAVVTEAFFEQGAELRLHHPALFAELHAFFQVDTGSWPPARVLRRATAVHPLEP
jgi:Mlc titration factor MtfA (ptsG expression regulator)